MFFVIRKRKIPIQMVQLSKRTQMYYETLSHDFVFTHFIMHLYPQHNSNALGMAVNQAHGELVF